MDLWIRSQDRQKLVKVKTIEILDHHANNTKEYVCTAININYEQFASYKSKERALEVLDDIQDVMLNEVKGENHLTDINYKHCNGIVLYQMPKE